VLRRRPITPEGTAVNRKQEASRRVAAVIASYVAFLALKPEQSERRRELIEEVVRDCDERYGWLMYSVIRAMGLGHEDREDVIQDILLRWAQRLESGWKLPAPEALTVWFRTVARNAAMRHIKRERKRKLVQTESARRRFAVEERTLVADLAMSELPEVIAGILERRCTERMRLVFFLRCRENTYAEIAKNLENRSEEAVRGVMRRVVDILEEELNRLGWEY
jgi:RNA polymerase sigma factor (sigma-70 family)